MSKVHEGKAVGMKATECYARQKKLQNLGS